jgi:hypothetical protein
LGRTLLLISDRKEDQDFAVEVALAASLTMKHAKTAAQGAAIIAQEDIHVVLADGSTQQIYQGLETAIQESVGLFSDKINANAIHFISSEDLELAPYLLESPLFGHFVLRNFTDPKNRASTTGTSLKQPFRKGHLV